MRRERPSGSEPVERSATSPTYDAVEHYLEGRGRRGSVRKLSTVGRSAVGLAYRASPRLFVVMAASQLVQAALLGLQILLGKLALQAIFDAADADGGVADAILPLAGLVAAQAVGSVVGAYQVLAQRLLGERVQRSTLESITDVTTTVDLERFESPQFFDDIQRVQAGAIMRPVVLATGLVSTIGGLLGAGALAIAMLTLEPLLLPILLASALPLMALSRITGQIEFDFTLRQTPGARLRQYLILTLTGRPEAAELRAFAMGPLLKRRWGEDFDRYLDDLDAHVLRRLKVALLGALVSIVVTSAAFALLLSFVLSDRLSLATAGAAVLAVRLLTLRIQSIFSGISGILESGLFLEDLERFLAQAPERGTGEVPEGAPPLVELDVVNARFGYPETNVEALRGVSLKVRAGEVVALVGENGSGKTTLAKLAAGLFAPTAGEVRWNGELVTREDMPAMRSRVGIIFQDFVRYQLSAAENIRFGDPTRDEQADEVRAAAALSGADAFIEALPKGYDTNLGKAFAGGVDLSGGQWQRIALARAYYRSADLLILDEPTASLDARAEHELFEQVRALAAGRAVLMISHRFSTVRSADRIYVLHHGSVVEEGSHEELMRGGGRYAELFDLQASSYR